MDWATGVDVGSTTVKVVVVGRDGRLHHAVAARHHGRPREALQYALTTAETRHGALPRGITGSLGVALAADLRASPVHEVEAVVAAARSREPDTRTIVELGGQDAKLVLVGAESSEDDAQMNDRCAAGTGATLDRVATRLGFAPHEVASLRLVGDLRVAAKCGVFAERDVVGLVKHGASREEAFSALLRAIVVQNLAVLARGKTPRSPVLLLGGPHAYVPALADAWREALASLWRERRLDLGPVAVPEAAALFAAIGAALHVLHRRSSRPIPRGVLATANALPALTPPDGGGPSLACAAPPDALPAGEVVVHLGIDAGSTTSKAVLLGGDGAPLLGAYGPATGNPIDDARTRLEELADRAIEHGASLRVASVGVTGYGAPLVGPALGADAVEIETLAHVRSALAVSPDADVVVDVGGTDVKVLRIVGGALVDFFVSNQCAAGLGAFLATTAGDLGVPVEDFAARALVARRAPRFTVGCAIFADTDRVSFQRDGYGPDELLAGLAWALPRNVFEFVVAAPIAELGKKFVLSGGVHRNLAVAWAQARYLRERIPGAVVAVHPHPEIAGAIGAALAAKEAVERSGEASRFVGFDDARCIHATSTSNEATRCKRCEMECARTLLTVSDARGKKHLLVVGNACERGADEGSTGERTRAHAPDLVADEATRLFRKLLPTPTSAPSRKTPVFGIPRVMGIYRCAPLLLHYLRALGVPDENLVVTPPTTEELYQDGARRNVTDPCFPAKLVLSHVDWLLRGHAERPIDVLLIPTVTHASIAPTGTADTASCPIVAACGHTSVAALRRDDDVLARLGITPMTPSLCLPDRERLGEQLFDAFAPVLGTSAAEHEIAFAHALAAQREFLARGRRRAAAVLDRIHRTRRAAAVLLARPYHVDPGVQHGVSTELASRGVPVLTIASLPIDDPELLDLSGVLPLSTNSGDAEKLWAARFVARDRHLFAIDLASFKCGQDAAILGVVGDALAAAGRPVLRLHDLDEDRPTASLRVPLETFVASVRRYEAHVLAGGAS